MATDAQRKALAVLQLDGYAYVSNVTTDNNGVRHVYWQTARWLVNAGYAKHEGWENGQEKLVITDQGREAKP